MKKNIFVLISIIGLIIVLKLSVCAMEEKANMTGKLSLTLSLDKEKYIIGDEIRVNYVLKNISNGVFRILPWGFEYATNNLIIFDKTRRKNLEKFRLLIYELKFIPEKEDFISLSPGGSYTKVFKGIIKEENLPRLSRDPSVKGSEIQGVFIDFKDSALLLIDNNGEYIITATYESNTNAIEKGKKRYGFTDIWEGNIKSNEIHFSIAK